jgi:hypothetical protein
MKSLIIIINWLLSLCSLCIDTERSPMWAVLLCLVWFIVSCWATRYASPEDANRGLAKIRRFCRQLAGRPKFDFESFNRGLETKIRN